MKTSELTDAALSWAVAKCEGYKYVSFQQMDYMQVFVSNKKGESYAYDPCGYMLNGWSQGDPIIERERIGVWPSDSIENMWAARPDYEVYPERLPPSYGSSPLIAAMRCYVASKLGDTVDIPDDLLTA